MGDAGIVFVKQGTGLDCYEVTRLINTTEIDVMDMLDKHTINNLIENGVEVIIE